MPYSEYVVSDRKAVAQLKYHIRKFCKEMAACGTCQADMDRINALLHEAFLHASGRIDFDDSGSRITNECKGVQDNE